VTPRLKATLQSLTPVQRDVQRILAASPEPPADVWERIFMALHAELLVLEEQEREALQAFEDERAAQLDEISARHPLPQAQGEPWTPEDDA
jgi:hypothetical protein